MINNYHIIDLSNQGIPFVEIRGASFNPRDLYDFVGAYGFMTTFFLRVSSASELRYGSHVTGVLHYHSREYNILRNERESDQLSDKIFLSSVDFHLSAESIHDLKFRGFDIQDVEYISFLSYRELPECHPTGEKKVPNIINIEIDTDATNIDHLSLNFLTKKHNDGVELAAFEQEEMIGIMLGLRNGVIDSRILKAFNLNIQDVSKNHRILKRMYEVKGRNKNLSAENDERYLHSKNMTEIDLLGKVLKAINNAGFGKSGIPKDNEVLKNLIAAAKIFRPRILLHGKRQVYWDLDSYLHILTLHIKNYQLGELEKTIMPYRLEDLELVVEKVIGLVKVDYQSYRSKNLTSEFVRKGRMAIYFNGDYYQLRIGPDGRLVQFHTLAPE